MHTSLPFFNWSLKRAQETQSGSFGKARIGIIYVILLISLLKSFIVIGFAIEEGQWLQVTRAAVVCAVYIIFTKILLYKPSLLTVLAHIMVVIGVLVVCSNIFVYAHRVNLVTLQFVFMIAVCSFYVLGSTWGVIYSIICIVPVIAFLIFKSNPDIYFTAQPQEFPSPGYEIIAILNFITIIVTHYLFYRAFNLNIEEKERLNEQLQLSIAEANRHAESKSNFLSTISHELRTPLHSVIGMTELLIEDDPEDRQRDNLKILRFSALDLLSLINNVLDFNKIDSDKLALESVPFSLAEFTSNICAGLRIKANDKGLRFVVDVDPQLDRTIIVSDPTRLSQVIYNLVGNAIKFTDKGSITVALKCANKTANSADVLFSITDTGIGIHPDKHESIFEQFAQAEAHTARRYGGTGLGLAIVRQLLSLFKSAIYLESTPGVGTKFYFTISFATAADSAGKGSTDLSRQTDISHLRVLVAEDNDINRSLIRQQLHRMKLEPVLAENGKEAYNTLLSGDFDVIFLDLHMPELDGYETIKRIRALQDPGKASVYIIAFTASVNEQQKIFESGFNDFLHKPVNMHDLREKLERFVLFNGASYTHRSH